MFQGRCRDGGLCLGLPLFTLALRNSENAGRKAKLELELELGFVQPPCPATRAILGYRPLRSIPLLTVNSEYGTELGYLISKNEKAGVYF